jgi:hypothetical protein
MTTENEHKITSLTDELLQTGFVHLKNQTEELLQKHLADLGQVIFTTDVKVKPDSRPLVTSDRALDFHTDHHKAKYIAWYCHKQTDKGGESILMDAEKIYSQLSDAHKKTLENIHLFEHKIFPDDKESNPLVNTSGGQNKFYYSFWLVSDFDKQNRALQEFQRLIKTNNPVKLTLQQNDLLIIDNHRILHGRTAIEGSKDRYLKRYWISNNNQKDNTDGNKN